MAKTFKHEINAEIVEEEETVKKELEQTEQKPEPAIPDPEAKEEKDIQQIPSEETQTAEDLISKANVAAERQEKANDELREQLDRQERMNVEKTLGGKADAGSKELSEEEKQIRDTDKYLEGTGFEGMLNKKK